MISEASFPALDTANTHPADVVLRIAPTATDTTDGTGSLTFDTAQKHCVQ